MAEEPKLKLTKITIGSELKMFSLEAGKSSGSTVTIEFDLPADPPPGWTWQQIWTEKKKLDIAVLTMELARGSVDRVTYDEMRERHRKMYDNLLGRKQRDESDPRTAGERGLDPAGASRGDED